MANTKPIGIAYEDPALSGATFASGVITSSSINASTVGTLGGTAGFFGTTPVAQPAALSTVDLSTLATSAVSYLTTNQIAALSTSVNGIITKLQTLGLTA